MIHIALINAVNYINVTLHNPGGELHTRAVELSVRDVRHDAVGPPGQVGPNETNAGRARVFSK